MEDESGETRELVHADGIDSDAASSHEADAASSSVPVGDAADSPSVTSSSATSSTVFSAAPNNSEEGERALELGHEAVRNRDYARAERLFAKSLRLRPSTEAAQELARMQRRNATGTRAAAAAGQTANASSAAATAAPAHNEAPDAPQPPPARPQAADGAAAATTWRRHTLRPPTFLANRVAWLRDRSYSYSYPSFFYIPPAQRRPILLIWSLALVLAILRLTGTMHHEEDDAWPSSRRSSRQRSHVYDDGPSSRSSSGRTWSSTAYSTPRVANTLVSVHNLLSLLPFVFFFFGPMIQRFIQQRQQAQPPPPVHHY